MEKITAALTADEQNFLENINFHKASISGPAGVRTLIAEVESLMKKLPQIEVPVQHHFSNRVYAREMKMNKGELVVGKIHKFSNLHVISQGDVSILSTDGLVRIKAPATFVASAGTKRLIYAHEETVWTTVHGTEQTDVEKIEDEVIAKDYSELMMDQNCIDNNETSGVKVCLG